MAAGPNLVGMVSIGGTHWMLLFAAVAGLIALVIGLAVGRRMGALAGFAWFGLTLEHRGDRDRHAGPGPGRARLHPRGRPRRPAAAGTSAGRRRVASGSFGGGQQLLNTLLFVPAGVFLVLAFGRWRGGWVLIPLGLAALAAYSLAIEETQLHVVRIDRACDVTDIIDNVSGAVIGVAIGLVLLPLMRPWRAKARR